MNKKQVDIDDIINDKKPADNQADFGVEDKSNPEEKGLSAKEDDFSVIDEWAPDLEELRRELNKPLND